MELSVHQINELNKKLEDQKKIQRDAAIAESREASIAVIKAKKLIEKQ